MALSGTVSTNDYKTRYYYVKWSATQSVTGNTSTLSWTLGCDGGSSSWYAERTLTVTLAGSTVYSKTDRVQRYSGTIASGSFVVNHDANGAASFNIGIQVAVYTSDVNCTGSSSFTLDTIPRKSELSSSDGTLGTAVTINVTRKSSSFTHTITYWCGDYKGTICTKSSSTSFSWTPPLEFSNGAPNGTSVYNSLIIETFNGSTSIGTNSYGFIYQIPASVVPTVSLTVEDDLGYASTYGGYVQTKSKAKVVVSASGKYGSTIKSYSTTVDGRTYTASSFTSNTLNTTGKLTIKTTITDSRNRTATATKDITVLSYASPKITSFSVKRCKSSGREDSAGTYLAVIFSSEISSLSSKNTATYTVEYKKASEGSYTSASLSSYDGTYSVSGGKYVFAADTSSSYDVVLKVADAFSAIQKDGYGQAISKLFSWLNKGLGWAFGKVAELENALEIAWKTYVRGDFYTNGSVMINGSTDVDGKNLLRETSSKWSDWITPRTNGNNIKKEFYYIYDLGKLSRGTTISFSFDIEFSGVTEGSGGTFAVYTRDVAYPNSNDNLNAVWGRLGMEKVMNLSSPPSDGVYHYSKVRKLDRDFASYARGLFLIRCDYWGSGKYRVRNVKYAVESQETDWTPAPEDSVLTVDGPSHVYGDMTIDGLTYFNDTSYDQYNQPITNGLTLYTGSGNANAIDPNTTLYDLILSDHSNGPGSGSWYIQTYFYNSKTTSSNRVQYAFPYSTSNGACCMWHRYYYNGTWTKWIRHENSPDILYENSSGTNGTVTLNNSAANYNYLEVIYIVDGGNMSYHNSSRVPHPNGKHVTLPTIFYTQNVQQISSCVYLINGTTMTRGGIWFTNLSASGVTGGGAKSSTRVVMVLGYV